jgi:hypothetical protein
MDANELGVYDRKGVRVKVFKEESPLTEPMLD